MTRNVNVIQEPMHVAGDLRYRVIELDITSYTAGGESLTPTEAGFERIDIVTGVVKNANYCVRWDQTNNKVMLLQTGAALSGVFAEAAAAVAAKAQLLVMGK